MSMFRRFNCFFSLAALLILPGADLSGLRAQDAPERVPVRRSAPGRLPPQRVLSRTPASGPVEIERTEPEVPLLLQVEGEDVRPGPLVEKWLEENELEPAQLVTLTVQVRYLDSNAAYDHLKRQLQVIPTFATRQTLIQEVRGRDVLLVTGPALVCAYVVRTLELIDLPDEEPEILLDMFKLHHVSAESARNWVASILGLSSSSSRSSRRGSELPELRMTVIGDGNTLVIRGEGEQVVQVVELLKILDKKEFAPAQGNPGSAEDRPRIPIRTRRLKAVPRPDIRQPRARVKEVQNSAKRIIPAVKVGKTEKDVPPKSKKKPEAESKPKETPGKKPQEGSGEGGDSDGDAERGKRSVEK